MVSAGYSSAEECLPSMHKVLDLIPSKVQTKKWLLFDGGIIIFVW
jgi:hypothetical protein